MPYYILSICHLPILSPRRAQLPRKIHYRQKYKQEPARIRRDGALRISVRVTLPDAVMVSSSMQPEPDSRERKHMSHTLAC
ncbi:hypothetical protein PISMIDRAFT_670219 [Pisolithus microcarpus 441]|uniref:Uncharacterized protein n=1 Tax=Pisolithus microcarpus 441 TaxID=765257 RepID=A0A0C9ZYY6_9AGAM|nr:hypothetical protein PISMIDRAFT_670219 [Pisolithus microcarpus 441]